MKVTAQYRNTNLPIGKSPTDVLKLAAVHSFNYLNFILFSLKFRAKASDIKRILFLLAFGFYYFTSSAQSYPVQINTQLVAPYSGYLPDYADPTAQNLKIILQLNDFTQPTYNLKLKFEIKGNGFTLVTKSLYNPPPISLQPGQPVLLSGTDIAPYLSSNNLDFIGINQSQYEQRMALPEGYYSICVTAYDYYTGSPVQVSNEACGQGWFTLSNPPLLNLPFCNTVVNPLQPQNLFFSWTPVNLGSPNSAFNTSYLFELWEMRPDSTVNPNQLVQNTQPIFSQVTTINNFNYGMAEPALNLYYKYAWRVRVIDGTGRDWFVNNGYSQVCTFYYGSLSNTLGNNNGLNLQAEALDYTTGKATWTIQSIYNNYQLEVRKANTQNWFPYNTPNANQQIDNLEPNKTYECRVKGFGNNINSDYSNIAQFTTPNAPTYNCNQTAPVYSVNSTPLPLNKAITGALVRSGQFDIVIKFIEPATNGPGWYKGNGYALMFGVLPIPVTFTNVFIDDRLRHQQGVIEATTQGIQNWMKQFDIEDAEDNATYTEGTIDSVYINGNQYCYTTIQNPTPVCTDLDPGNLPEVIRDGEGNQYVINEGPPPTVTGPTSYINTSSDNLAATDNLKVEFSASPNQNFGFDGKQYAAFIEGYEAIKLSNGKNYFVPNKSIGVNQNDKVYANCTIANLVLANLNFKTSGGATLTKTSISAGVFEISNIPANANCVYAWYNNQKIGKLNVLSLNKVNKKLVLVPVNGASTMGITQQGINDIYKQANTNFTLTTAPNFTFNLGNDGLEEADATLLKKYSAEMRALRDAYKTANTNYDKNAYYVFVVSNFSNAQQLGYMVRGRAVGFIKAGTLSKTLAHELAHGAFGLEHTFPAVQHNTSSNLLDDFTGSQLVKQQWQTIQNPGVIISWLDGEEDGSSYGLANKVPEEYKDFDGSYSFITPNKKIVKLPKELKNAYFAYGLGDMSGCELFPSGVLTMFTIKENGNDVEYKCKINGNQFLGYFKDGNVSFAGYLTPNNCNATNNYTCTNTAIFGYPTAKAREYYRLSGLSFGYYNGESAPIMDLKDPSGSSTNLGAQNWTLVKTYFFKLDEIQEGIGSTKMNSAYTEIMDKMNLSVQEKNEQAILMTKVLEYYSVYENLLPAVTRWNTINDWGGVGNIFTTINSVNGNPINYFLNNNLNSQSYSIGGYFEYQVDSAGWQNLSKPQLLTKFLYAYQQVAIGAKATVQATLNVIKQQINCTTNLTDPTNTIKTLNQINVKDVVNSLSVTELQQLCANTRAQLIAVLVNGGVFNETEKAIYKLMYTCNTGADRADFLVAMDNVVDVNGKRLLLNLVKSVDDQVLFSGSDYNTWIMKYFINSYQYLLKNHSSPLSSQYFSTYIQPKLISTLTGTSDYVELKKRYVTFNYANFVKRLFKELVGSINSGYASLIFDPDMKSTISYSDVNGKLSYENKLTRGFKENTVSTLNNISAFEPMVIDVKGDLLGTYSSYNANANPIMPAIVLLFAEEKANAKTTQDAVQTGIDLVSLAIPGAQSSTLLKVLNYADKLSSVTSIIATSQSIDNPKVANALNIVSTVLGITNFASGGDASAYVNEYKSISTFNQASEKIVLTKIIPENHADNVLAMCAKINSNSPEITSALLDPTAKQILEKVVVSEIEAAKQAGKYSALKTPLDNALAKIKFGFNYFTATGRSYFDGLVNKIPNFTLTNGAYKKGTQTVAHLQNDELVIDAVGDASNLGNNANLLEYAEDISFKKTNTGSVVSEDVLIFDDNGTIKCLYGNNCFVKNTLVKTKIGLKAIQDITTQDSVLSFEEANKKTTYNKVKVLFKKSVNKLQRIIAGMDTIVCTGDHKFYSEGKWIKAAALVTGSVLQLSSSVSLPVTTNKAFDSTATVYNFEVENNHNYFVGKQSILVHNDCKIVTNLINDGKLTKAQADDFLKDFAGNQTLLTKFGNGELDVKAWASLVANNSSLKTNSDVLTNFSQLTKQFQNVNWVTFYGNLASKQSHLELLSDLTTKLGNGNGIEKVISDIILGGNKNIGASFVLNTINNKGTSFRNLITKLEAYEFDELAGVRYYDIQVTIANNFINYECKSWLSWNANTFKTQFLKDLQNMTALGSHKWVFKNTPSINSISSLKQNVLSTLADNVNGVWIAKSELTNLLTDANTKSKLSASFGFNNTTNIITADKLVEKLNDNIVFNQIFEVLP